MQTIKQFIMAHRWASAVGAVVVIGGYLWFRPASVVPTHYVVALVQRGTLVVSVAGSGQIAASNQVDIKAKTSGDVLSVPAVQGQTVKAGAVLAVLDQSDALKAVRDAQNQLQSAQLSLQKLQVNQQSTTPKLSDDLSNAYQDAFNQVTSAFLTLPSLTVDIHGILYDDTLKGSCMPNLCQYDNLISASASHEFDAIKSATVRDESSAQGGFNSTFQEYRNTDSTASIDALTQLLNDTSTTAQRAAQTLKDEQNLLDLLVKDLNDQATIQGAHASIPSQIITYQALLATDIGKINAIVSTLRDEQRTIMDAQQAITDARYGNPIDLASQQNTIQQRQDALTDAQKTLANTVVRAPFDGVVAKVTAKKGDLLSSGSVVATLVSPQQIATLTLNEVDAAKVMIGQPVTLTFDAIPDLTIAGKVSTIDTIGTVSQGVVTYSVQISLSTQDARIRPGMSTSASIVTRVATDVLIVPSSAIKNQGGQSSVEVFDGQLPLEATSAQGFIPTTAARQVTVQTGLSNDTDTVITSGLTEGTEVVTRTITSAAKTTASTPSLLNAAGVRTGSGAGGFRGGTTTGR